MIENAGQSALLHIIVNIMFLVIAWWSMQAFHIDKFVRKGKVMQARVLFILLTVALANLASDFFLKYLNYSTNLQYLFS
ncbi:DUF1146 family protein [Fictibacillus aquaticus]|uniref:DUF1146 family protein n=1 Tax=Fictibacillus aquaticus TaxID=2021314 RepID=UPI001F0B6E1D|nr:DUF1146 family protein [Fictibacillus aquaticus]